MDLAVTGTFEGLSLGPGCYGHVRGTGTGHVPEQTLQRWRAQYGGLKADDAKRLKELERENARLKQIVADQLLENQALKAIAKGNF